MELYIKILADFYAKHGYWEQMVDPTAIIQDRCYQALCQIKAVIEDTSFEDDACFQRIEEIICTFESLGSTGGFRHDFG